MSRAVLQLIDPQKIPESVIPLGIVTAPARAVLAAMQFEWVCADKDNRQNHLFVKQVNERGVDCTRHIRITLPQDANTDDVAEAIYGTGYTVARDYCAAEYARFQLAHKSPPHFPVTTPPSL